MKKAKDKQLPNMSDLLSTQITNVFSAVKTDIKDHNSPSSNSLKVAVHALVAINHEVVDTLCKFFLRDDINKDPDLLSIIELLLKHYFKTLKFYHRLETYLSHTHEKQTILDEALNRIEGADAERSDILQKLESFKAVASKFPENLNSEFESFYLHQHELLHILNQKKEELKGKSKRVNISKKVLDVFFTVISVTLKICSDVFGLPLDDLEDVVLLVAEILGLGLDYKEQRRLGKTGIVEDIPATGIVEDIPAAVEGSKEMVIRIHEQREIMALVDKLKELISNRFMSYPAHKEVLKDFRESLKNFSAMVEGIENNIRSGSKEFEDKMVQINLKIISTKTQSPKCGCCIM